MGFTNFVSEAEAINLCGVTAKTLSRFAEAGYLSVEKENDGLKLYSSEELEKVFGKPAVKRVKPLHLQNVDSSPDSAKTAPPESTPMSPAKETKSAPFPSEFTRTIGGEKNGYATANERDEFRENDADVATEKKSSTEEKTSEAITINQATDPATPIEATVLEKNSSQIQALLEMEREETARLRSLVEKLERINEVNEKIIELREERLNEVRLEREWLRERIERLEQKAERDQVLLLSETQLMKQLLQQQTLRRSPVRAALEWVGLVEPKQPEVFPVKHATVESSTE